MKVVITENQNKLLLTEGLSERILKSYESMVKFTNKVLKETKDVTGVDFGFLMSWGATLGGLMMPVSKFIEGEYPELTSVDLSLLVTGVMVTFYSGNKKALNKILSEIKQRGLVSVFDEMLSTTTKLKDTFLSFIGSLNITMSKISNMLAYTFLIPILPQLYEMANMGFDQATVNQIIKRLLSYGTIIGSSIVVREIIKKVVNRFKN